MTDFNMLMQKAREMQEKLMRQQRDLAQKEITGTSGGGMIEIVMTGKGEVKRVKIDPSVFTPARIRQTIRTTSPFWKTC